MAGTRNGFKLLVKAQVKSKRVADTGHRRKLDDYETPEEIVRTLTDVIGGRLDGFRGPLLEPACGSGRLVRGLRKLTGKEVQGFDIKRGHDFLKRVERWRGDIVTNPPYRDGLAEKFCRRALKLADGRVAMLMQSGFPWGGKRARGLYRDFRPEAVIVIPDRIYFIVDGVPLESQFFNHCWIVWPERAKRKLNAHDTLIFWAGAAISTDDDFECDFG